MSAADTKATATAAAAAAPATATAAAPAAAATDAKYDYDLIVIGGGSGGLACAKEAARLGAKVALFDYVTPSPQGTTWGLGGTCVNVGCIPKKLFHHAGILRKSVDDAKEFGWEFAKEPTLNWPMLVERVNNVAKGANFSYKNALRSLKVKYINAYASFVDAHTVEYTEKGKTSRLRAAQYVCAFGGRPRLPDAKACPGAIEYGVSSDDVFTLAKAPGKTLVVGASYIALECGGFLNELGFDVTVMVRSILLRGFDQQMANVVGELTEIGGVRFVRPAVPTKLERRNGKDGPITVTYVRDDTKATATEEFDTVLFAIGRDPQLASAGLAKAGVAQHATSKKILVNAAEQTNVPHIFAIGDAVEGRPELTPTAIRAGLLLARRLYSLPGQPKGTQLMDYSIVPTAVFTPYEYGAAGLSEEQAKEKFGAANVDTYLSRYGPTEVTASMRTGPRSERSFVFHAQDTEGARADEKALKQSAVAKLVVHKTSADPAVSPKVVGIHYVGHNAGEIIQGFAIALRFGATKADFDNLVAIHPTAAEEFTMLEVVGSTCKTDDDYVKKGGCCG